jgi:hypothetical protein
MLLMSNLPHTLFPERVEVKRFKKEQTHRMGKATNKLAALKRVYQCWHENPCEAAVGIYVEL